jgi:hypothetical protein
MAEGLSPMTSANRHYSRRSFAGLSLVLFLAGTASSQELCDVNQDGKTTTGDALTVLRAAVGQSSAVQACTPTTTTTTLPPSTLYFERNWVRKNTDGDIVATGKVVFDATSASEMRYQIVVTSGTNSIGNFEPEAIIQNNTQYQFDCNIFEDYCPIPERFCHMWNNAACSFTVYSGVTATSTISKPFPAGFDYDAPFRVILGFFGNPADDFFDVVP